MMMSKLYSLIIKYIDKGDHDSDTKTKRIEYPVRLLASARTPSELLET